MANRVPLIVDTTNLHLKELPLGDALDLTGCGIVGLTSFTPGTGGGFRFVGVTTFGMGTGLSTAFFNDGIIANYLRATNLTDNQVITAGVGGSITSSSNLTFDESTLAVTGALTVSGNVDLGDAVTDSITPTGRFDAHIVPLTDGDYDLGASGVEFKDLYIDGTANIDALIADSAKIVDVGNEQVLYCSSADGEVAGSANLTFNGSKLTVTGDLDVSGSLNYTNVTDIYSVGVITAAANVQVGAGISVVGVSTFTNDVNFVDQVNILDVKHTGIGTFNDVIVGGGLTVTGAADLNGTLDVDGQTDLDVLNVAEAATFSGIATFQAAVGIATHVWFGDNAQAQFGSQANGDLRIYHDGANSVIDEQGQGVLQIRGSAGVYIQKYGGTENLASFLHDDGAYLYDGANNVRFGTTTDGADVSGTGSLKVPVGTTAQRNASPVDGDIRYNSTLNSYEGYGNSAWGGLGGGTEIDNIVATASATGVGTFAHASYRSASIRAQINQGGSYQVGRYLLIHDGSTVTVVEEAAIATGSMLGSFDGVINGSNVEFKVTMVSAGIATVTTIIDKITV